MHGEELHLPRGLKEDGARLQRIVPGIAAAGQVERVVECGGRVVILSELRDAVLLGKLYASGTYCLLDRSL